MNFRTLRRLLETKQIPILFGLSFLAKPIYRASFVASAGSQGVLKLLGSGPKPLTAIADDVGCSDDGVDMLKAWLDLGVRLGELQRTPRGYALKGWWSRTLAKPSNDPALAALEEIVQLHHAALIRAPKMAKEGRRFSWKDYDVDILSRVGPLVEPFNHEATELVVPRSGRVRLLDVGCGLGGNIKHAAELNPELLAVGLEMIPEVAATATENMKSWGLSDRVRIDNADFRKVGLENQFDAAVAHGNYYFFEEEERLSFLNGMYRALAPGGRAMVATACRGKHLSFELISLWFSSADFGGPLPTPDEVEVLMRRAGFRAVSSKELAPGGYAAIIGRK